MSVFDKAVRKLKRIFLRFHLDEKLWLLALDCLPQRYVFALWHRSLPRKLDFHIQKVGATTIKFQDAHLIVHWSDFPPVGSGPSASLYILQQEVMRLDCFGGDDGHMHFNPEQCYLINRLDKSTIPRIYFPAGSRQDHIARATFELKYNFHTALATNVLLEIQNYPLDANQLAAAADDMHRLMTEMLVKDLVAV